MSTATGIELGPDYCILVKGRTRGASVLVESARVFEPFEWPHDVEGRAAVLDQVRQDIGFPRRVWAVNWDFEAGQDSPRTAEIGEMHAESLLARAGFLVEAVLSPAQALALLGGSRELRPGEADAALWLALNHKGAALAVVRGFETLYAREFLWKITAPEQRVQAHLLRRYLMVAQIIPEARRAIDAVRSQHGIQVGTAVACGTIPDLRSMTMPLISALDIEFETMDSSTGLSASPEAGAVVTRWAPALRLAWVSAAAASSQRRDVAVGRWLGAAAVAALVAGAAWLGFAFWSDTTRKTISVSPQAPPSAPQSDGNVADDRTMAENRPPLTSPPPASSQSAEPVAQPTSGRETPVPAAPADAARDVPLPSVGGILIAADRRYAIVDGAVVSEGDRVGPRIVVRIETGGIVLRDPSGREVRVLVRGRGGV